MNRVLALPVVERLITNAGVTVAASTAAGPSA